MAAMDALALLDRVSDAYRNLNSLIVEAAVLTESGDENHNQRSEQRVDFHFAAPNRIRYETRGKSGLLHVCDGSRMHTLFRGPHGGPRYSSMPAPQPGPPSHAFRPDVPFGGGNEAFLFDDIGRNVETAELLREEPGVYVVSVTYRPPDRPHPMVVTSPVSFWIDAHTYRILRHQGDMGHRFPTEDEIYWTRHTVVVRNLRVDEPIPGDTFDFTPPPDAVSGPGGVISTGGGGGFAGRSGRGGDFVEHQGSHEWQGDTLVERSRWKLRGMTLAFERRLTFSAGNRELDIVERAVGPKGETETRSHLQVG
jgi:outer membrane lipoprotein-sorting protein